jgi:hypothetical protein
MLLTSVVFVAVVACIAQVRSRSVTVDLQAPWKQHDLSFLAEISEFVHDQSPTAFWTYMDRMCVHNSSISAALSSGTDRNVDQEAVLEALAGLRVVSLEATATLAPASMQTLISTMINLGHYLPAIQFSETLAGPFVGEAEKRCGANYAAFAVLSPSGEVVCSPSELSTLLASVSAPAGDVTPTEGSVLADWEHVYPVDATATTTDTHATAQKAVLYGILGTPAFCELHTALASAAREGSVTQYAVRHHFPSVDALSTTESEARSAEGGDPKGVSLQGYGVLLDIKNMEYKNVDDSATAGGGSAAGKCVNELKW